MKLDSRNNIFTITEAIKSIVYQLRICKQKTTNVTPFQAHFGRKPNTPLSNISTIPKSSNLSHESVLHYCLDADTVAGEDFLDDNGWVSRDRSDILIEEAMQKAQVDSGRRYSGEHNKSVSRFIIHPKLNNPISRSEKSLDLKLAHKATKRSKRDLRGLWETLSAGSTVECTSDTTTVIKEPGVPEVRVRNSDIAKFGTRAERQTDIWQYAQRRPLPYEKMTEEKISQHMKDLKKKYRGEIKIRHRPTQSDAASGVSSANSDISKAMSSRKPKNLKQEEKIRDNLLQHSIRPMHLQLRHRRPNHHLIRPLLQSPKEIAEPHIILALKVLCALLATTLPPLHPNEQGQQTRSLRPLYKKRRHNLHSGDLL